MRTPDPAGNLIAFASRETRPAWYRCAVLVRLDSFREEIIIRAAEYMQREARRHGADPALALRWPVEARDLAHERGWLTSEPPGLGKLRAQRERLADARRRAPHPVLAVLAEHAGISDAALQLVASCAIRNPRS
jgi:hypothetical protein